MARAIRLGAVIVTGAAALATIAVAVPAPPAVAAPLQAAGHVGQPAEPAPRALPVLGERSAYAHQVLRVLRPGEPAPTQAEVQALAATFERSGPPAGVRQELASDAVLDARIAQEYQRLLGRAPDPEGLAHWRAALRTRVLSGSTADVEALVASMAASSEAWRLAGSTNAGLVDRTYATVLGRAPDAAGRAYWIGRLDAGLARYSLARALVRSGERATKLVDASYLRSLERAADAGGRRSNVARYRAAQVGELGLALALLTSGEARRSGCDPLDPANCLLPFPSDHLTVPDATTATGRRVSFKPEWMPRRQDGTAESPVEWNRNDGFSPGSAVLVRVPGVDLDVTGAAGLDDIGASLDADAPIVLLDADTGERRPYFAELDANGGTEPLLIIRPAVDHVAGHRYVVALRGLKRSDGTTIPAGPTFAGYRDGQAGDAVGAIEARRAHLEGLFATLADAGIARDDLYLAWDFTVASTENTTGRLLHLRDDALAVLDGKAPPFTITSVADDPAPGIARQIAGTYQVPSYLTGTGAPGSRMTAGPDGLPVRNGWYTATFRCSLPEVAAGEQVVPLLLGHGLFGDGGMVDTWPSVRSGDTAACGTEYLGLSRPDLPNAAEVVNGRRSTATIADRFQQGQLNSLVLGRLMTLADGFDADPAFQLDGTTGIFAPDELFYEGYSYGGNNGSATLAISPDITAGVFGVAGINYSTMLERSVDSDGFLQVARAIYPDPIDAALTMHLQQMLWDRGDGTGYAPHVTRDPLPGASPKRVLLYSALGDHQVPNLATEVLARTLGIPIHRPVYEPGRTRDVAEAWGLPALAPGDESGMFLWDTGAELPPLANVAPRAGADPHGDPVGIAALRAQIVGFLRPGGTLGNPCGTAPCTAP